MQGNPNKTEADFPGQLVFRNSRGHKITRNLFGQAIVRACQKAGIEPWSPNMLRHAAATKILAAFDIESARAILGHGSSEVTRIYAEPDLGVAMAIAAKIG
jgi:site-specific recombinase XerD